MTLMFGMLKYIMRFKYIVTLIVKYVKKVITSKNVLFYLII